MEYILKEMELVLESNEKSDKYLINHETKQIAVAVKAPTIRINYTLFNIYGEARTVLTNYNKGTLIKIGNNTSIQFENKSISKVLLEVKIIKSN